MALSGKLTAKQINQTSGPTTLNDGNGLYLKIRESGSRSWFCRIRHPQTKKLKDRGMGSYPEVSVIDARRMLPHIKEQLTQETSARLEIPTFREYAELFIDRKAPEWRHPKHKQKWTSTLENHAHLIIGDLKIQDIETHHLITLLTPIWTTKTETAVKLRQRIEMIIDAATVEGFYNSPNPARWRGHLSHLLPDPNKVRKVTHYPSMPYQEVPSFIGELRQREALSARLMEFVILTACRQSEARLATYDEVDTDQRVWTIPASRIKANREHRVPLTDRMLELINECRNDSVYLFAENGNPLSINALRMLMNRMGVGEYTPHGFRSSFRTWGATNTQASSEALEVALSHYSNSSIVSVYRRTDFLELRLEILTKWHSFLTQHISFHRIQSDRLCVVKT